MVVLGPPWDINLWLYPGANPAADATAWGLPVDISTKIRYPGSDGGQVIGYSGGKPEGAIQVDPGKMSLTLDNTDGRFSTENAMGLYWPLLDLGTPIRLGVPTCSDSFTRSSASGWGTADTGNTWSLGGTITNWTINGTTGQVTIPAANTAVLALCGQADAAEVDVVSTIIPNATATGASYGGGPFVRYTDNNNMVLATLEFNTAGNVTVKIRKRVAGVETEIASLNPVPVLTYSAAQRWRIRVQADGPTIRAKVWPEASSEPAAWHISATESSQTGAGVGLYLARFNGNTNATGPQLGIDDFKVVGFEFTGNVAKWPVRWDMTGRNCYAPITADGILARLQQAKGSLQTPLEHQLPFYSPTGYWTLQDGPDSANFASAVTGVSPATYSRVTPAADSTLAGGSVAPVMAAANGVIRGSCKPNGGTGFSAMFFVKLASLPGSKTLVAQFKCSAGRVVRWNFSLDATTQYMDGYDVDGVAVVTQSNLHGGNYAAWMALQLETEVVGANTNWAMTNHQVGDTVYYSMSGSYASTVVSKVTTFQLGGTDLNGAAFAHVWLGPNTLPFVTDSFSLVSSGYATELASDRAARIAAQSGIAIAIEPGPSEPCGPQRTLKPIDEIQSASDADYGVLYERGSGLGFRPRSQRRNRPVLFALSVAAGQIAEPPEPIRDNAQVRNSWKVSRDNGSYAVVSDPVSIAAVGEWPGDATINVATDDVLVGQGELRTFLGSRKVLRWPGLNLDFARNPALLQQWRSRGYGPRMTVTTGRPQVVGADPDVIVEGFACELDPRRWVAVLACSEAAAWDVGVYDDPALASKLQASSSTLQGGGINTTALSLTVDGGGETWKTGAVSLVIVIDGEWIPITNISGTGPYTLTASSRSLNGVVKSHLAGAVVKLAKPAKYTY